MADSNISSMVQDIIKDGKLTTEEKKKLDDLIMADGKLSLEERQHLDKLLAMIARGELKVGD